MVDTRSSREAASDGTPSMLGAAQLAALLAWLGDASRAPFKVVASSVPWADGAAKAVDDGWRASAREREQIIDFIAARRIAGVMLLSGDLHWAGVWELRPWLPEFSASPLRTFPLPHSAAADVPGRPEKTLFVDAGGRQHLGQLTFRMGQDGQVPTVHFVLWGWRGWGEPSVRFEYRRTLTELTPP